MAGWASRGLIFEETWLRAAAILRLRLLRRLSAPESLPMTFLALLLLSAWRVPAETLRCRVYRITKPSPDRRPLALPQGLISRAPLRKLPRSSTRRSPSADSQSTCPGACPLHQTPAAGTRIRTGAHSRRSFEVSSIAVRRHLLACCLVVSFSRRNPFPIRYISIRGFLYHQGAPLRTLYAA